MQKATGRTGSRCQSREGSEEGSRKCTSALLVMRLLWESLKFYHRRRRHTERRPTGVMPNKKEAEVHRAIVEYTVVFGRDGDDDLRGNSHYFIATNIGL